MLRALGTQLGIPFSAELDVKQIDADLAGAHDLVEMAEREFRHAPLEPAVEPHARFVPFTAETRMSGIDWDGRKIRKGSHDAIEDYVKDNSGIMPEGIKTAVESIAREGGTPLVVAEGSKILGAIRLKDVLKENIRKEQADGHLVAMTGDGTNDSPALAQADVAVAMNAGTQAAREAANMVDLDSNPAKLLDIVEIGKQILITRGALTTFSMANDVSKYFAILPAIFAAQYPMLNILNIMQLTTPTSAVLSAIIFNAVVIPLLIPLALRGVKYRPTTAIELLRRNLLLYGFGGLIVPFIGIKLIDVLVVLLHLE